MPMFRNMRLYSLILVLAVLVTFAGGWTLKAEGSSFTDLAGAEWAWQATVEMAASGIVAGYPDGSYGPYNSVTKLEAVAMLIRMLGLEDQAKAAAEAGVDYNLPADLYWGSGYLIMAVQRGMLDEDYVYLLQPNVPATRTEVAMLVFHALKLNPDSSEMKFEDADQVAAEYRDGVAAVVKSGIMQGLPGNVFKPNDEINRAQMAVMMSSIIRLKYADPCPGRRSEGIVSDIDLTSRVINIKVLGSIFYVADCDVFLDGARILPENLKAGDEVKIILDENHHAVFINALRPSDTTSYKGVVSSLQVISGEYWLTIISDDGQEITRSVAEGVMVNDSGTELKVSTLSKGDHVEILVSNNKINEINSLALEFRLKGVIRDLDFSGTKSITIRNDDGDTVDYNVSEEVKVEQQDGGSMDFEDLQEGDRVRLELNDNFWIGYIELFESDSDQLEGIIRDLDTAGVYGITIRNDDGEIMEYKVDNSVEVDDEDGGSMHFKDLEEGDRVRVELNSSGRVDYIEQLVTDGDKFEGEIRDLDVIGAYGITIRTDNGSVLRYDVTEDINVEWNGDRLYFDDLKKGQQVRLELNSSGRVDYIEVMEQYSSVAGKVSDLMNDGSPFIRVQKSTGITGQYDLTNDTEYYRDGDSIDIDDIVIGSEVEVRVYDNAVTRLDVINDEDIIIEGTIISVNESDEKIRIKQASGNIFSYGLADDPILRDNNGFEIDLDEIDEDFDVRIDLENGEITSLTVL